MVVFVPVFIGKEKERKKKRKENKKRLTRNLKPKDKKPKHVKRNLDSTKGTSIHLILLYPFVHLTIFI